MSISYDSNRAVIESARKAKGQVGAGQFGEQHRTAADPTVLDQPAYPPTDRQLRLNQMEVELAGLERAVAEQKKRMRAEALADVWEHAPVDASYVYFRREYEGEDAFYEFVTATNQDDHLFEQAPHYNVGVMNRFAALQDDESVRELEETGDDSYVLDVGPSAAEARLAQLREEARTLAPVRATREIRRDIEQIAGRALCQLAAQHDWEGIVFEGDEHSTPTPVAVVTRDKVRVPITDERPGFEQAARIAAAWERKPLAAGPISDDGHYVLDLTTF